MIPTIIENVAIVVQPHQQLSNSKNRKYGGVERVVTSLIEGLLNRNVNVTLYTAKHCHLGCNVRYPIGILDEEFGQKIEPIQLSTYSRKIRIWGQVACFMICFYFLHACSLAALLSRQAPFAQCPSPHATRERQAGLIQEP